MKTIQIKGMSCNHCVMTVTKALAAVPGLTGVSVSLEKAQASFEESGAVDLDLVRQAVRKAGFEPGEVN